LVLNSELYSADEDNAMMDRPEIDRLLRELYGARARADLDGVCGTFSHDAKFRIAGTSHGSPIAITALGVDEIRQWLLPMIKSFQLTDHTIQSIIIDGTKAAVHWRARIHSRITGETVLTELIDLVQVREGRIASYTEFLCRVNCHRTAIRC
jgi:ketosteroid isomerase-like protein